MFPPLVTPVSVAQFPTVSSIRQTHAVLPHSRKTPVFRGAGHGPEPPPHGRVSRCRSRWASSCVAWNHPVRTVPRQTDMLETRCRQQS